MKEKLIYERKYPHIDRKEIDPVTVPAPSFSGYDIGFAIHSDTQYTPIPNRIRIGEEFIRTAIEVSELYRLDAQILEQREEIQIILSFDFGCKMQNICRLLGMADRITFYKDTSERDLSVRLDLYTHVVVKNGIAIAP